MEAAIAPGLLPGLYLLVGFPELPEAKECVEVAHHHHQAGKPDPAKELLRENLDDQDKQVEAQDFADGWIAKPNDKGQQRQENSDG